MTAKTGRKVLIDNVETYLKPYAGDDILQNQVDISFSSTSMVEEVPVVAPQQRKRARMSKSLSCRSSGSFFFQADWLSASSTSKEERERLNRMKDAKENNEADSVSSEPYYEPTDFKSSNWMKAMDAPTLGMALVALTTAITHPLLFVAGALTAVGTATAVGAGYDYFREGPFGNWLCLTSKYECGDSGSHPVIDTVGDDSTDVSSIHTADPSERTMESKLKSPDLTLASTLQEQTLPENWLNAYYPLLENTLVEEGDFIGLNVVQFFQVFFANMAPYSFMEFQKKRGDEDIVYGTWKDLPDTGRLSLHPNSENDVPREWNFLKYRGRELSFRAKTNSFLGPPYATTAKTQRIFIVSKRLAVLESKTILSNIPFCDRFFVMERWVITAEKSDDRYNARVVASCEVFFLKSCPFEQQIRSKSITTITDVCEAWCIMAKEALKLTQQVKLDRLRQSQTEEDTATFGVVDAVVASPRARALSDLGVEVQQHDRRMSLIHDGYVEEKKEDSNFGLQSEPSSLQPRWSWLRRSRKPPLSLTLC